MQKLIFVNGNEESINLTAGNFGITNWAGLSNADLNLQTQQVPFQDGSVFIDALLNNREISVTLAINDNNDLYKRYQLKREVISALNPKFGEGYLYYTNDFYSRRIKCVPQLPIFENKNSNDSGTLKASLAWTACGVYWESVEDKIVRIQKGSQTVINNDGDLPSDFILSALISDVSKLKISNIKNNKYVEIDNLTNMNGVIISSKIGEKGIWSSSAKLEHQEYSGSYVTFSETFLTWVLAGMGGIYTSKDFKNFEKYENSTRYIHNVKSIGNKIFLFDGDYLKLSEDGGYSWSIIFSNSENTPYDICFFNDLWYLFCGSSQNKPYLTSEDLETWEPHELTISGTTISLIRNCCNAKIQNQDIIFALSNNKILTYNGTWSAYDTNANYLQSITFSSKLNKCVVVGNDLTIKCSSDLSQSRYSWNDGVLNVELGENESVYFYSVIWVDQLEKFVAVGNYADSYTVNPALGIIIESFDGLNWTIVSERINLNDVILFSIAYSEYNGEFLIGGQLLKGDLYELQNFKFPVTDISAISYIPEMELLCGPGNYTKANIKKNNEEWKTSSWVQNINQNTSLYIKPEKKLLIPADNKAFYTYDGDNWGEYDYGLTSNGVTATYSVTRNIICSIVDGIKKSMNGGESYTQVYSGNIPKSIARSDSLDLFIAVGNNGLILKSSDGETWAESTLGERNFKKIKWIPEKNLFLLCSDTKGYKSSDGETWIEIPYANFNDVCYSKEQDLFMILLYRGEIVLTNDLVHDLSLPVYSRSCCYSEYEHKFYITGSNNKDIMTLNIEQGQNIINHLTEGSDLTINLEKGRNSLVLTTDSGTVVGHIKFNEKYIGV